ncbi:hypothetical protein IFM89_020584 [Coptis chinensis]|uniref:Uncharacterized protein n=1 Tax=Coptis chinensis TaxID=261450 RepID=A0A835M6U1_9MAGN|nr:hypothetical protein IFM89_020584 [Coptis chinensis]
MPIKVNAPGSFTSVAARSSSYSDPIVSRVQVVQQVIGFAKHLQLVLQGPFLECHLGAKSEQQSKLAARKEVLLGATLLRPLMMLGKLPHTYGTTSCVQFFSNLPCKYASVSITNLEDAWKQWTTSITGAQIFLGLPAAPRAASSGFIPINDLTSEVLPAIKGSSKYGGVAGDLFSEVLQPHTEILRLELT